MTPVWFVLLRGGRWTGADGGSVKVRNIETLSRVSLMLEDGVLPVVAEGEATLHRGSFPQEVTDAFTTKYGWDVAAPHRPGGDRVLLHVPVLRRLPAGAVGERASARLGGPDTTGSGLPASENRADPTVVGG